MPDRAGARSPIRSVRRAAHAVYFPIVDPLETELAQANENIRADSRSAAVGSWPMAAFSSVASTMIVGLPPKRASACAAPAVGAIATRASIPAWMMRAVIDREHRRITAEEMPGARGIDPDAVRRIRCHDRAVMSKAPMRETRERGLIALGIGINNTQIRDAGACFGERQSRKAGLANVRCDPRRQRSGVVPDESKVISGDHPRAARLRLPPP